MTIKPQWAKAGWYFKPGNEEDEQDNCVCPYCERAVAMLEQGDDPLYVDVLTPLLLRGMRD